MIRGQISDRVGGGALPGQNIDENGCRDEKGTSGNEPRTEFCSIFASKAACIDMFFDFGSILLEISMRVCNVFQTKSV